MRIFRNFSTIPTLVRWAIIVSVGLFILALVIGFFNRSTPTAGSVSVIAPAARPSQIAAARPAATAPQPAAAPTPQTAAPVVTGGVMRAAQKIPAGTTFDDCASETLGLPENQDAFSFDTIRYITAATRRECKTPTLSASVKLHEAFALYSPQRNRSFVQLTRAGLIEAALSGEHTVVMASTNEKQTRCALYIGDTTVPVAQGDDYHGRFSSVATVNLQAGFHEAAFVCALLVERGHESGGVTVSIRAPGEDMPRLATLQTARAPAVPAAPAPPVQEPAK
jgi:hypothetical protein